MEKGYYLSLPIQVVVKLSSQSTIKMEKGYYKLPVIVENETLSRNPQ